MKQFIIIFFLLGFCVNQLHLVETIASIRNTTHTDIECNSDKETPIDEKEEAEKELEDFTSLKSLSQLSDNPFALLSNNFSFINLMYSHPYTQRDIKPPCNL